MLSPRIAKVQGGTPPLRGGNLSVECLPRVSPWAIFVSSLREVLRYLPRYFSYLELLSRNKELGT